MSVFKKQKVQILEYIVLAILFLIKIFFYYTIIEDKGTSIVLSLVSLTHIIFIVSLINMLKGNKRVAVLLAIYITISFAMFADALYFTYFNQFTSIIMLRQFSQISVIGESISEILKPTYLILIADIIPLIFCYITGYIKGRINKSTASRKKSFAVATAALAAAIISTATINAYSDNINIFKQEFFSYHLTDVHRIFFSKDDSYDGDKLLMESIKNNIKKDKELYGIAKGRNVITIQVEGLQNFVINREYNGQVITPNLNSLIKEDTIYFDRYYQQLGRGNTSDAEFVTHNSLYPAMDGQTYIKYYKNTFYGLPWILKDKGYNTAAFHGYKASFWNRDKAYIYQGFDKFYSGEEDYHVGDPIIGFGINDSEFFKQTAAYIKTIEEPFYAFIITLSSHHPFRMADMYKKIKLEKRHEDTTFGNYIQAINYTDSTIGWFIKALKDEGIYDKVMLNIYGDHYGLSVNESNKINMTEYLGYQYDYDEMMRVPLIVCMPNSGLNRKIGTLGGQIDFLPTVLNLLGIENRKGIMLGQDLINAKEGFVAEQTYMQKGSYFKDDIAFYMSRDGIYNNSRAWSISTRQEIDLEECREGYERAIEEINRSNYILKNDVLKRYFADRRNLDGESEAFYERPEPEKLIICPKSQLKNLYEKNSKEALNKCIEGGYKFIQLDLEWVEGEKPKFLGLAQMTMDDLMIWILNHKDIYVVINIKNDNVEALRYIKDNYPEATLRIIPEINKIDEFIPIQGFGYTNIILALHQYGYKPKELMDFVKRHEIYAVAIPIEMMKTEVMYRLKQENIFIYTYATGNMGYMKELKEEGIDGFYIGK
ncbi:MAG: sulfatase-like hydrolase/transferase [Firmicutes bacterium]|nr:sulfatase-like hydrolase/transferase [Bacillota bacterium]